MNKSQSLELLYEVPNNQTFHDLSKIGKKILEFPRKPSIDLRAVPLELFLKTLGELKNPKFEEFVGSYMLYPREPLMESLSGKNISSLFLRAYSNKGIDIEYHHRGNLIGCCTGVEYIIKDLDKNQDLKIKDLISKVRAAEIEWKGGLNRFSINKIYKASNNLLITKMDVACFNI